MILTLVQISVALVAAHSCGWVAQRLGQTRVIGEMIGGILLGPSLLGRLAPHPFSLLIPPGSSGVIDTLSKIGLILYLFGVGISFDHQHLLRYKTTAILGSGMSILLPFLLAVSIAPALQLRYAPPSLGVAPFALFLGISMSVTAFPVLARIVEEKRLSGSPIGTIAVMCAAVDDLCAWILLAVALSLIHPDAYSIPLFHRFVWLAVYVGAMLFVVRPIANLLAVPHREKPPSNVLFAMVVMCAFASAAATDSIGLHPLFGAFLAGVCFPRAIQSRNAIQYRLDKLISRTLLPLFFVLTGMRMRIDLLNTWQALVWCAGIAGLAIIGKIGGALFAVRIAGHSWRDALTLGVLMNTRGLVELVVLNIAFEARVFSSVLFTMLVTMALITTMMTAPMLDLLGVSGHQKHALVGTEPLPVALHPSMEEKSRC